MGRRDEPSSLTSVIASEPLRQVARCGVLLLYNHPQYDRLLCRVLVFPSTGLFL